MGERVARRILLLGWDAADWKIIQPLLDAGRLPHLEQLINEGVSGNLATLKPILSPMLWTSIATGKLADQHGIHGFVEPKPDGSGLRPVTATSLRAQPLWSILENNGLRSAVVGWFATHPARDVAGTAISNHYAQPMGHGFDDWPLAASSVSPAALEPVMTDLRLHPAELSLDELQYFVPDAAQIDTKEDTRLNELTKLLAKCTTVHAAGTYLAEHGDWDLLAVYHDAIDLCCHDFMELRAPRMPDVSEADFTRYRDVVDQMYCFHDLMLGRYMRLVGPETTIVIVSDHGFHSDHLRPRVSAHTRDGAPVQWHRDHGVFIARGPGLRQDELVYGASLLDIAPTVLTLLGLPVGRDMAGRVLTQCFAQPVTVERIETHEPPATVADNTAGAADEEDPWAAQEMLRQLVDLGYIDEPPEDAAQAVQQATLGRYLNLSEVYYSTRRYTEAAETLEKVLEQAPENLLARLRLARSRLQLGDTGAARELAGEMLTRNPEAPQAHALQAEVCFAEGDDEQALASLQRAAGLGADLLRLRQRMGRVLMRQQKWVEAEEEFRAVLELDADCAEAYHGLGWTLHHQARHAEAVDQLMRAVALRFDRYQPHVHLGAALAAAGNVDGAIAALHNAVKVRPKRPAAHDLLARLYEARGDSSQAQLHRSKAAVQRTARQSQGAVAGG